MARSTRFFRWYRTLPLLLIIASAMLAAATVAAPKSLMRRFLYPLNYREMILDSAQRHGVDPTLVCAVIKCESNWDANARSGAGAVGLMQIMPDTADTIAAMGGVDANYTAADLTDPATNIEFGCAYLAYLQSSLANRDQVIVAYNAGIGMVESWLDGGDVDVDVADVIAYPETRMYLIRVNTAYDQYHSLYDTALNPS